MEERRQKSSTRHQRARRPRWTERAGREEGKQCTFSIFSREKAPDRREEKQARGAGEGKPSPDVPSKVAWAEGGHAGGLVVKRPTGLENVSCGNWPLAFYNVSLRAICSEERMDVKSRHSVWSPFRDAHKLRQQVDLKAVLVTMRSQTNQSQPHSFFLDGCPTPRICETRWPRAGTCRPTPVWTM